MYQPARIRRVLFFNTAAAAALTFMHLSSFIFNAAAAATLTFIYQLPTTSPPWIGRIHYALSAETNSAPATISNCYFTATAISSL